MRFNKYILGFVISAAFFAECLIANASGLPTNLGTGFINTGGIYEVYNNTYSGTFSKIYLLQSSGGILYFQYNCSAQSGAGGVSGCSDQIDYSAGTIGGGPDNMDFTDLGPYGPGSQHLYEFSTSSLLTMNPGTYSQLTTGNGVTIEGGDIQNTDAIGTYPYAGSGIPSNPVDLFISFDNPISNLGSATIIFPTSTYNGPDFTNWVISLNGLTQNINYYGKISYQNSTSFNFVQPIYQDIFQVNTGNSTSVLWTVYKLQSLFNYQNNTTASTSWTAILQISTSSIFTSTSSEVTFIIRPDATSTPTQPGAGQAGPFFYNPVQGYTGQGSTVPENIASSSAYLANQCTPAADWTDIGGGLRYAFCATINYLVIPNTTVSSNVQAVFTAIQGDFPFNMVYGTIGLLASEATAASSTANIPLTLSIWNMNIPILSSSTFSGFVGGSNKDLIFTIEDGIAWVGVAYTIIKIIF